MPEMGLPLAGKRAVVTGATKGIGRSVTLALAAAGADVALNARGEADLTALRAEIEGMGRRALALPCDVTDPGQVTRRLARPALDAWGSVDILVNNAGNAGSAKFLDHPDELWHRMLAINLTSVYYVTKAFTPAMITQRSGRIITVASIAGKVGGKYIAAYTASKHGVVGLTRALAVELNQHGITVNAICPGYVDTPMTDASVANMVTRTGMSSEQARQALERMSPQNRLITPDEVASVAVFLAQDGSRGITGQAINVDGGEVNY
ncbi:MAG TPA: SDR family NAD(P)-dependent oxidoreductase [Ktedonobacterales bacterium]|jgi:NAD(P)-dependent dehydrogenase (short-subunit alcohol dehydrogenase family)|nr:SDR family NAD(P)-dependent oxidoreductase [Ktedonobacterales bacterium]